MGERYLFEIRCIKPITLEQSKQKVTTKNKVYPVIAIWTNHAEGRVKIKFINDSNQEHTLEINNEFFRYHFRVQNRTL